MSAPDVPPRPVSEDVGILRARILGLFPELAGETFSVLTAGWDSVAVDVGDRLIFKFPRDEEAAAALRREASLLAVVRPRVSMPVPELVLHPGPPLFSHHAKLPGEHLVTAQYERLPEPARIDLANRMARFYAELHAIPRETMQAAGAEPMAPWQPPDEMLAAVLPRLPIGLHDWTRRAIAAWTTLPPDPYGTTYGFFDGHGWNMAFDHAAGRLNGIYDFADSGLGPLHLEFIYSNFVSPDLTERIIAAYERETGRAIERQRVALLTAILRLSELAGADEDDLPVMQQGVVSWALHLGASG